MSDRLTPAPLVSIIDRARAALRARMAKDDLRLVLENVIAYAADLEAEHDKLVRWHLEDGQSLDRLQHMVAGLKVQQEKDDAEYAEVIAERDRFRLAWKSARRRASNYSETVDRVAADRDAYVDWLETAEQQLLEVASTSDWRAIGRDS